jgi:hypothetical protein
MADADSFFNKIITVDETRCFAYNPETKRQSTGEISLRRRN